MESEMEGVWMSAGGRQFSRIFMSRIFLEPLFFICRIRINCNLIRNSTQQTLQYGGPMRSIIIIFAGLFLVFNVQAQQTTFSKVLYNSSNWGVNGLSIAPSSDESYIIVGRSGILLKISSEGEPLWGKTLSITDPDDSKIREFTKVISTEDSCFFIIGSVNSSEGEGEGIVLKTDKDGQILWSGTIQDEDAIYPISAAQTHDKGFIVTGRTYGRYNGESIQRAFFCKIDNSGSIEWLIKAHAGDKLSAGLSIQDTDSSYTVSGYYELPDYRWDGFLLSLSYDGDINWAKKYNIKDVEPYYSIQDFVVNDKGFIIYLDTGGHVCLVQTDPYGNVIWTKRYSWLYSSRSFPYNNIIALSDGGYAFTYGNEGGPGGIIKTDSAGNPGFNSWMILIPTEIIETSAKECLVFGTGPIQGVKSSQGLGLNTGLIQLDSFGSATLCAWAEEASAVNDTVISEPLVFTSSEGGLGGSIQLSGESILEVFSKEGCVDAYGDVEEIAQDFPIRIYPNPTDGVLNIELKNLGKAAFAVFNSLGKEIIQLNLQEQYTSIDLTSYGDGIYFYRLVFPDKSLSSGKIVVSR